MKIMTNEEKKIRQLFGNDDHFQVPEGYFDNLTEQIMKNIPEQESVVFSMGTGEKSDHLKLTARKISLWQRLPLRRIAASVAVIAVLGTGVVVGLSHGEQQHAQMAHVDSAVPVRMAHADHQRIHHASAASTDDAEFDQMADYTMMDSQDIYASLIAEN